MLNSIKKKGYLHVDLGFALLIFFMFFLMIHDLNQDSNIGRDKLEEMARLSFDSKDICSLFISYSGLPLDWEGLDSSQLVTLGLKSNSSNYLLSTEKISALNSTEYSVALQSLNLYDSYFNVKIVGMESSRIYLDYGVDISKKQVLASSYVCYSFYNNENVKIITEVWK